MTRRWSAALLVALALALGGCGGDSGGGGQADRAGTTDQQAGAGGAPATTGRDGALDGATGQDGDVQKLDPEANREPAPKGSVPPDERTGTPPRYTRKKPVPEDRLKAVERPIFEQSRYLCRRLGIDGMRREYRIESSDPQDVAREVAKRTYLPETRDAVYSGCLAGLRAAG